MVASKRNSSRHELQISDTKIYKYDVINIHMIAGKNKQNDSTAGEAKGKEDNNCKY